MRRPIWALWIILLLPIAWMATGYIISGTAAPDPLETAIEERGATVMRAVAGAAGVLARGDEPAVMILVDNGVDASSERDRLGRYVEKGGDLVVVTIRPEAFQWGAFTGVGAYPGRLYASDGRDVRFHDAAGGEHAAQGLVALRHDDPERMETLWETGRDAFRDSNANGRLDAGEAAGPFVVAARIRVAEGTFTIIGAPSLRAVPVDALVRALPTDLDGAVLVVDAENPGSTSYLRVAATVAMFPLIHPWLGAIPIGVALAALSLFVRATHVPPDRDPIEQAVKSYLATEFPEGTTHERPQD